jgi:glutaredoxin
MINVPGTNKGEIILFALSTCAWCKKTKALLEELNVNYNYINVDLVMDETKHDLLDDLTKYNSSISFPTIIINNGEEIIVGYDEKHLKELFK